MPLIYKIVGAQLWNDALAMRQFDGAPIDLEDGYIHFSDATQVPETAAKHFFGQTELILLAVDSQRLGQMLKWEVSRNGALFPHLYAPLPLAQVLWARAIPLHTDGTPNFDDLLT